MGEASSKTVMVTGGNRGIGLAIARVLLDAGRPRRRHHRTGGPPEGLPSRDLRRHRHRVRRRGLHRGRGALGGPVEVLVANAGITQDTLLLRMSDEDFDDGHRHQPRRRLPVRARASQGMIRLRGPDHLHLQRGRPATARPDRSTTPPARPAWSGLARSISRELGGRAITANVVAPGFVETDMTDGAARRPQGRLPGERPRWAVRQPPEVARRGALPRLRRRGLRHRRRHPGRRRPRHGALSDMGH